MSDEDLNQIGIRNAAHRQIILTEALKLPACFKLSKIHLTSHCRMTVKEWLTKLDLVQYLDNFLRHKINDLSKIVSIWDVELENMLEIDKLGHRKRILYSLSDLNENNEIRTIPSGLTVEDNVSF